MPKKRLNHQNNSAKLEVICLELLTGDKYYTFDSRLSNLNMEDIKTHKHTAAQLKCKELDYSWWGRGHLRDIISHLKIPGTVCAYESTHTTPTLTHTPLCLATPSQILCAPNYQS